MEEWLSKLIKRDSIAMVLYARFPSEMAYSHHIIQVAKGFVENNCDVNIYYPKTYNKKTLKETPEEYYGNLTNIRFIQINNVDITSFKIYEIGSRGSLPYYSLFQKWCSMGNTRLVDAFYFGF